MSHIAAAAVKVATVVEVAVEVVAWVVRKYPPAMMDASQVIHSLALAPHPEGGWYREVYRSPRQVAADGAARSALTSIYYLLERPQVSRWHIVDADEAWHFYAGAALALFTYDPAGRSFARHVLAPPGGAGEPVHVVPAGHWQGARSLGAYSLVGCSVAPGFEFAGFHFVAEMPGHEAHVAAAPAQLRAQVRALL